MNFPDPVLQTLGLVLPLLFANFTLWIGLCPFSPIGLTVICTLYAVGYIIATTAVIVATIYVARVHQPANSEAPSPNLNGMPKMAEKKEPSKKEEKEEKEEAPKKAEKKEAPKKEEKQEAPKKAEKKEAPKKEVPIKVVSVQDANGNELQSEMLVNALMEAIKKATTVHPGIWVDDCVFLTFYEIPKKKPGEKGYEYGRFHYFYREISLDELNNQHPNIRIRPGQKRVFYKLKPEKLAEWKLAKDEIGHDPKLPRLYSNMPGGLLI